MKIKIVFRMNLSLMLAALIFCMAVSPLYSFHAMADQLAAEKLTVQDIDEDLVVTEKTNETKLTDAVQEDPDAGEPGHEVQQSQAERSNEEQVVEGQQVPDEEKTGQDAVADDSRVPGEETTGLSTWSKVGIGAGVALVAAVALGGGGGSDGSSSVREELIGAWSARAVRTDGSDSYTGTYTLDRNGTHTYDIYVGKSGHKTGNGNWTQPAETLTLILNNDTGSVYQGDFPNEEFNTITLMTSDGRWRLNLTKM